ncbi:EAL domain-containing protein [Alkalihalobacterium elongatum]|uniref:EAL domain-containing protein n=1 Tax=Alkalihalobacterium elongatum TaxID=2675466 RepID=UPI001C1FDE7C|nr:EAL domain-containing protein [Alkalihalobacterium elongatum]
MKTKFKKFSSDHENVWHLFNQMSDGLMITDYQQNIIAVNPSFENITGYSFEEIVYKKPNVFLSPEKATHLNFKEMWKNIHSRGTWTGELETKRKNGEAFTSNITVTSIQKQQVEESLYFIIVKDISSRKKVETEITRLANFDELTQLPNRTQFKKIINEAIHQAKKNHNTFAVLFLDLDHFKKINDSLGHQIGDELLQQIAKRLQNVIGANGTVSRFGGDEFTILLSPLKNKKEAYESAKKIIASLQQPIVCAGEKIYMNTSIGCSFFPEHGTDYTTILKNADSALFQAKKAGRNQYQEYNDSINEGLIEQLQIERDLRTALAEQQFEVYYQLQMDIETGKPYGIEALIRWNHPERGNLPPFIFLPAAEETGLIAEIDDWVLQTACAQTKKWHEDGHEDLVLSVNISKKQFDRPDFVKRVKQTLRETGLNPKQLCLEITESMAITHIDEAVDKLKKLKSIGVQLSLDDFGTGYSSLSQLKNLPIDTLKIDKSFMQGSGDEQENHVLVKLIIAMAKTLNFAVICEGVETEEQLLLLRTEGCNHAQGYLFSEPLAPSNCELKMKHITENVNII